MANAIDDPTHLQIIEWFVGIIVIAGGAVLALVAKLVKSKKNKVECELIHDAVSLNLSDIKQRLEKGDVKMDGMKDTLIEIATTLKIRSVEETKRYDRHSEEWKDK